MAICQLEALIFPAAQLDGVAARGIGDPPVSVQRVPLRPSEPSSTPAHRSRPQ
jgi:hypothetical protein